VEEVRRSRRAALPGAGGDQQEILRRSQNEGSRRLCNELHFIAQFGRLPGVQRTQVRCTLSDRNSAPFSSCRETARLIEELRKAEIVIDIQKKVATLLGRPILAADQMLSVAGEAS